MNEMGGEELSRYYSEAESWSIDRQRSNERSRRTAWIAAGVAAFIALVEAFALLALVPLKREVPYTLLVDRQTGYVEALKPLERSRIAADTALTRSFLVQYVIARETLDPGSIQHNYRKVGLMSAGEARERYLAQMPARLATQRAAGMARAATTDVRIRSVSSLSGNTALVRFDTLEIARSGQVLEAQSWAAVVTYRYSAARMSAADRLVNPLGFQVVRYRKDPETLVEEPDRLLPAPAAAAPVRPAPAIGEQ